VRQGEESVPARILEQIVGGRLAGQGELDAARRNRLPLDMETIAPPEPVPRS
jgi:hypothetical protein